MQEQHRRIRGRWLSSFIIAVVAMFAAWTGPAGWHSRRELNLVRPGIGHGLKPYQHRPIGFQENRGQTDPRVKFLARGDGYALFLTSSAAVLKLRRATSSSDATYSAVRIRLKDSNPTPEITGLNQLAGTSSYFIGRNRGRWRSGIPAFGAVRMANVYPGIDLMYRGEEGRLEFDLQLAPGADAARVKLDIDGASALTLDAGHNLVIHTAAGDVIQHAPVIYQTIDGHRRPVAGGYVLENSHTVAFAVASYDTTRALVIDPLLTYTSYLGGTGGDQGVSIAVDQSDGSAWVTGTTTSTDFPVTGDALQTTNFGSSDIFITKISADGSGTSYSTYAGGSEADQAAGIAIDPSGNVYVTGLTLSSDFPISLGAFQETLNGTQDAFVLALDRTGALIYSTLLGTAKLW